MEDSVKKFMEEKIGKDCVKLINDDVEFDKKVKEMKVYVVYKLYLDCDDGCSISLFNDYDIAVKQFMELYDDAGDGIIHLMECNFSDSSSWQLDYEIDTWHRCQKMEYESPCKNMFVNLGSDGDEIVYGGMG